MQSPRLTFRKIGFGDYRFLLTYLSDPEVTRFLPLGGPYPRRRIAEFLNNRIRHWRRHGFGTWIISLKSTVKPIGYCGLEYAGQTEFIDIRYGFVRDCWGVGLATEAAQRCIEFGFADLNLTTIFGAAVPENASSIKILRRIGLIPCQGVDFYGGAVGYFQMNRSDYLSMHASQADVGGLIAGRGRQARTVT